MMNFDLTPWYLPMLDYTDNGSSVTINSAGEYPQPEHVPGFLCVGDRWKNVERISDEAFMDCKEVRSFTICDGEGFVFLGDRAFFGSGIEGVVTLDYYFMEYGLGVFANCPGLTDFDVVVEKKNLDGYITINGALYYRDTHGYYELDQYPAGNQRTNYTLYPGCNVIKDYAFYGAKNLQTVTLNSDLYEVCAEAFVGCDNLREIWIPAGLTDIDPTAFGDLVFKDGDTVLDVSSLGGYRYVLQDGAMQRVHEDMPPTTLTLVDPRTDTVMGQVTGVPSETFEFQPPQEVDGWVLKGWEDSDGNTIGFPGSMPVQDITLYALYEEEDDDLAIAAVTAVAVISAAAVAVFLRRH